LNKINHGKQSMARGGARPGAGRPARKSANTSPVTRARARARDEAGNQRPWPAEPAAYVSESNFFEKDWQRSYWGTNYERLRAIKRQYDPDDLFFVHHGVGSEDWSDDGFERRAAN
jgi:hypothetical protein